MQKAHAGVVLAKELITSQGKVVEQADEALRLARERLAAGAGTQLEVLDAQVALTTARTTQQRALADYNIAIAVDAAQAGFDEIQFDYLRFPDAPKGVAFEKPTTESTRLDAITGFLREARRQLAPFNVFLSADIFGYACWNLNDTGIGQRLEAMMPLVDYLAPMLYPSGFQFGIPGYPDPVTHPYEIVRLSLDRARARLGVAPVRFRPWLQAFKDYAFDRRTFDAEEVTAQIRAAADFGSDGWMLWNPRNTYDGIGLAEGDESAVEAASTCF